jgi:hypothetical protein
LPEQPWTTGDPDSLDASVGRATDAYGDRIIEDLRARALSAYVAGDTRGAYTFYEQAASLGDGASMLDAAKLGAQLGLRGQHAFWVEVAAAAGHSPAGSPSTEYHRAFNASARSTSGEADRVPEHGSSRTAIRLMPVSEAIDAFMTALRGPRTQSIRSAVSALASQVTEPVAIVSVFRRYRDTGLPPDGGRNAAVAVLAAATSTGIRWATRPPEGEDRSSALSVGLDAYNDFAMVTFNAAEVLLEGPPKGDIGFGTERAIATAEGEYMRALRFVQACAELGYSGAAKTTPVAAPTSQDIADARQALGLR